MPNTGLVLWEFPFHLSMYLSTSFGCIGMPKAILPKKIKIKNVPTYLLPLCFRTKIEKFIDDNKALMRRMYGEFTMNTPEYGPPSQGFSNARNRKRHAHDGADYLDDILVPEPKTGKRRTRQSFPATNKDDTGR